MSKFYLTERELKERKFRLRQASQDDRLIKNVFPGIELIKVECSMIHYSMIKNSEKVCKYTFAPEHKNNFEIDCINRECSKGYFDLKNDIRDMYIKKESQRVETQLCEGSEAYDHMYQNCDTRLDYKITITYKS